MPLRPARPSDIPSLVEIEGRCFSGDRLDAAHLRRLLAAPTAQFIVAAEGKAVTGYALLLYRTGSAIARLYSFAVDPPHRRTGVATRLLRAAERAARARGRTEMRLEVRPDNPAAIAFYQRRGYSGIGTYSSFYEDGADALRMHKLLVAATRRARAGNTP